MRLGPESRRQVGDNFEHIIFQILQDFGWKIIERNSEIDVPVEIRSSGQQGIDGNCLYFDPTLKYDIGVHVESKKCKNLQTLKYQLPKWLDGVNSGVLNTNKGLFHRPFQEMSDTGVVQVQEGLLTIWIDEPYHYLEYEKIVYNAVKEFKNKQKPIDELVVISIFDNERLLKLQNLIKQLLELIGRHKLPGNYKFEYPKLGPYDHPNLMMMRSENIFLRAIVNEDTNQYRLVCFYLGETSSRRLKYFASSVIETLGQHINTSQGLHVFVWDFPPNNPSKIGLWNDTFRSNIEHKFNIQKGFLSIQGFNPAYPVLQK